MSLLNSISSGKIKEPLIGVVYGAPSVGKTSFAATMPKTLIIDLEDGSKNLNVKRISSELIKSYVELLSLLDELGAKKNKDIDSIAIDSLTKVEQLLFKHVMALPQNKEAKTIEDTFGSYGKWVAAVQKFYVELAEKVKKLKTTGYNVVIVAHDKTFKHNDPTLMEGVDRIGIDTLHKEHGRTLTKEFDFVFYFTFESYLKSAKNGQKAKSIDGDGRIIKTHFSSQYDAKTRYKIPKEIEFKEDFTWASLEALIYSGADSDEPNESLEEVLADLADISKLVPSDILVRIDKAMVEANGDFNKLIKIRNHARTLVGV